MIFFSSLVSVIFVSTAVRGQTAVPDAQWTALDAVLTAMNCPTTGDTGCPRLPASDLCGENRPLYLECSSSGDIVQLNVAAKGATGSISPAVAQLTALTRLEMRANNFANTSIPTQIGQMTNLVFLDLSECGLDGTIPTEIVRLTALSYLQLSENALRGSVPTPLSSRLSLLGLNCGLYDYAPNEKNCFDSCPRAQCSCALVNCTENGTPIAPVVPVGGGTPSATTAAAGAGTTARQGNSTTNAASGLLVSILAAALAIVVSI